MTTSDVERSPAPDNGVGTPGSAAASSTGEGRAAPARPSLSDKAAAPVLVKLPAPVAVRLSQLCWVLSLASGAVAIVYLFVIRVPQLPEIVSLIKGVDASRADATYQTAADIIFWSIFGAMTAIVLVQITLLVSFSNRRPHTRWWLLGTVLVQSAVFFLCRELAAIGERGVPLVRVLLIQLALAVLALLFSALRSALKWTARRHDVQRGTVGSGDVGI
jgi:hypothetical protein